MKIKNKSSRKYLLVAIPVLLAILVGVYMYVQSKQAPESSASQSSADQQALQKSQDEKKQETNNAAAAQAQADANKGTFNSTGTSAAGTVGMQVTSAAQDGSVVRIRTNIQTITDDGTCTARFSGPSGASYSQTVDVQPLASSTTCKGFDISTSNLIAGTWSVIIDFSNSYVSASVSQSNIEVTR